MAPSVSTKHLSRGLRLRAQIAGGGRLPHTAAWSTVVAPSRAQPGPAAASHVSVKGGSTSGGEGGPPSTSRQSNRFGPGKNVVKQDGILILLHAPHNVVFHCNGSEQQAYVPALLSHRLHDPLRRGDVAEANERGDEGVEGGGVGGDAGGEHVLEHARYEVLAAGAHAHLDDDVVSMSGAALHSRMALNNWRNRRQSPALAQALRTALKVAVSGRQEGRRAQVAHEARHRKGRGEARRCEDGGTQLDDDEELWSVAARRRRLHLLLGSEVSVGWRGSSIAEMRGKEEGTARWQGQEPSCAWTPSLP
ncbi:LOW QUALITY PROTEIN: hypothetical protein U9M48_024964 [Paspalum notatum var. saurae]|uniref:Uncharacterized protein n=1 Tax=Paspalum notatum var. saurae TaxID=547442 RepID=A0AAQ3TS99_PASNO